MDFQYIQTNLGTPLTMALVELSVRRPREPITFLSNWLFQYERIAMIKKKQNEEADLLKEAQIKAKDNNMRIQAIRDEKTQRRLMEGQLEVIGAALDMAFNKAMTVARDKKGGDLERTESFA